MTTFYLKHDLLEW